MRNIHHNPYLNSMTVPFDTFTSICVSTTQTVSTKPPAKTAGSAKGRLFDDSEEEDLFLSPATE